MDLLSNLEVLVRNIPLKETEVRVDSTVIAGVLNSLHWFNAY